MSKVYVNPDNENVLETLQPMRELQENPVGLLPRSEQNQISALTAVCIQLTKQLREVQSIVGEMQRQKNERGAEKRIGRLEDALAKSSSILNGRITKLDDVLSTSVNGMNKTISNSINLARTQEAKLAAKMGGLDNRIHILESGLVDTVNQLKRSDVKVANSNIDENRVRMSRLKC